MFSRHPKSRSIWRNKHKQNSMNNIADGTMSFEQLKSLSKRIGIINRLQQKQWKKDHKKTHKTLLDCKQQRENKIFTTSHRPATSVDTKRISNINSAMKAFKQQKQLNEPLIAQKYRQSVKTAFTGGSDEVKEGLLGEYERYNQMSKHELIEKLISLEYLANNIFRKNKALQQKIKTFDPSYKGG